MNRFVFAAFALICTAASARAGDSSITSAFDIASVQYVTERGISASLLSNEAAVTTVAFEESPSLRWNRAWGSFPSYVADVLYTLGDQNADYIGNGRISVSFGPRKVLIDSLQRFSNELEKRGLRLQLQILSRDMSKNSHVHGDVNSDHLIGFAADGRVVVPACTKDARCDDRKRLVESPLEVQLRIILAATAAGAQQLNMYGAFRDGAGQALHFGVSPFRNGSTGEMLGTVSADGTRRIGYGSAQRGGVGTLSPGAKQYVGFDGTRMDASFQQLLHNAPPSGHEALYNAIRERNFDWIGDVMD